MSNVSPEDIKKILGIIDTALKMHSKWHEELIRTLLCGTPMDESYIAKDAHRKCDFGCWFYSQNNSSFQGLPSTTKIGDLHKNMHDSAREICFKVKANGRVDEKDYDFFVRNTALFREELTTFRKRILDTLESVS